MCTFDAADELSALAVIHCNSENTENNIKLLELFNIKFPTLSATNKLAVSCDVDKGLEPTIKTCLPNAVYFSCIHNLLNLVSRLETDPGRIQVKQRDYYRTKDAFNKEMEKLKYFPDAYMNECSRAK